MTLPADITTMIVLGLAVARLTSLLVQDDIAEPLRHRIFSWSPPYDDPELGRWYQSIHNGAAIAPPREAGFVGRLVACYHCTGIWVSVVAILLVATIPTWVWPVMTILFVAQVSDTAIRIARGTHGS